MQEVVVKPKFARGDKVTLKASVGGKTLPPMFTVSHWLHDGLYDDDGDAAVGHTKYWCRRLYRDVKGWSLNGSESDVAIGPRLNTGEALFSEFELCLYEEEESA